MKKILITGGAGFIGSHLSKRLLDEGNYVICLDNLYSGSKKNIEILLKNPNFKFVEYDVTDKYFSEVNQIYNLACPASPIYYQKNPIKTLKTSVLGIINMLELAKENNASILQASTSEIYGNPNIHPQVESYFGNVNPIGIRSCYDEGKRCAETLMFDYKREYNTDIKVARIFNAYGPNMAINDGRVISNFIVQALRNEPITIYGDGSQTRSFCFVDDILDGLIKLMNSKYSGPYNLGIPCENTINEIAKIIMELTNSHSKIVYKELPKDDPVKRKPDISLAQKDLSFNPKVPLITGIKKTVEYFKEII